MAAKDMVHPESAARNPHTSALVQNVVVLDSEAVVGPPPRPALPPGFDPSFENHRCVACLAITNERDDSRPDVWNDTESMMQKRRCTTKLNAKRATTNEYHTKVVFVLVISSAHHLGRVTCDQRVWNLPVSQETQFECHTHSLPAASGNFLKGLHQIR